MSVQQITRESVLDAIRHGYDTRARLAEHFGVLPNSHTLAQAIEGLLCDGAVKANPLVGRLIPSDQLDVQGNTQ